MIKVAEAPAHTTRKQASPPDPSLLRLCLGFAIAPTAGVLVGAGGTMVAIFVVIAPNELMNRTLWEEVSAAIVYGVIPSTYISTAAIGVPLYALYRQKNWKNLSGFVLAGALIGLLALSLHVLVQIGGLIDLETVLYIPLIFGPGALLGGTIGGYLLHRICFWPTAGRPTPASPAMP